MEKHSRGIHYLRHILLHSVFSCTMMIWKFATLLDLKLRPISWVSPTNTKITVRYKTYILGIFYFTLGNLHPNARSKLSSINLLAIVKEKLVKKYGMDTILKPVVTDIKELVSHKYLVTSVDPIPTYFEHKYECNRNLTIPSALRGKWSHTMEPCVLCQQTIWRVLPWEALRRVALHLDCVDTAWLQEMKPSHW